MWDNIPILDDVSMEASMILKRQFIATPGSRYLCALVFAALALTACATRSISNSGYYADSDRGYARRDSPFYKGELNEFDVLGIDAKAPIGEADIEKSLSVR